MSDQLYCPECADKWSGAYNTDHRCVTCGSPLKAEAVDGELERVRAERDALAAHVEAGREAVEHARQWVPQHVWTRLWLWKEDAPTTSLAHLKAQWQAEAIEMAIVGGLRQPYELREFADKLRHQSQEGEL